MIHRVSSILSTSGRNALSGNYGSFLCIRSLGNFWHHVINIDKEFGNFEVKPSMGSLTLDHYLLLENFLDLATQIPLRLKQNILFKTNMPELPNFEEKIQILKLFVKSYKLGMKNPNFTQIGCVNCEV
jgi:hypothetical protein